MQCPNCGYAARERTRFCARCGQEFPQDDAATTTPAPADTPPAPPQPWGVAPPPVGEPRASAPPPAPSPAAASPNPYAPPPAYAPPPPPPGPAAWNTSTPPPATQYGAPPPPYGAPPPQYGAPPYAPYGQYPPPGYGTRTNPLAIASLILGAAGWIVCVGSIVAVVLGFIARSQIKASGGRETGDGMAKAGIILGFIGIALIALYVTLAAVLGSSS